MNDSLSTSKMCLTINPSFASIPGNPFADISGSDSASSASDESDDEDNASEASLTLRFVFNSIYILN